MVLRVPCKVASAAKVMVPSGRLSMVLLTAEIVSSEFQLIVCDGPPGHTLGGRYGLLPIVGNRLRKGAVILLDDAERSEEQVALRRWAKEAGWEHTIKGDADNAYAVVTV